MNIKKSSFFNFPFGNKKIITLLIISLFVLVGCKEEDGGATQSESPYIGGSKGVIAEFLEMGIYNEGEGIEEIFEGETFPIEVMLKNKGEEDVGVGDVTIVLKGISIDDVDDPDDQGDFSGIAGNGILSSTEAEGVIEKLSESNDEGGEITLDFTPGEREANYTVPLSGALYDVSVFGEVIYKYKTHVAVPKVCFKENLQDEKVCDIDEMKTVYSSGAPIQVKSAEEKRAGTGKIAVEFKVENVGGGEVTKPGEDFNMRYDQLSFTSSDPDLWECKAGGKLNEGRFDSAGKMTIVCKLKEAMTENTLYVKELDLTLEYKYKELIQRQIRIREQ